MKLQYSCSAVSAYSRSRDRFGVVTKEVKGCLRISKEVKGYLRRTKGPVKRAFLICLTTIDSKQAGISNQRIKELTICNFRLQVASSAGISRGFIWDFS